MWVIAYRLELSLNSVRHKITKKAMYIYSTVACLTASIYTYASMYL